MSAAPHLVLDRLAARRARRGVSRHVVFALAALVLTLLVPAAAHAAVPMCSTDARTVAAPPIIMPWRKLTLEAPKPCQQTDNPLLRAMPEQQQRSPSSAPTPAPLRALPLRAFALAPPSGIRQCMVGVARPLSFVLVASIYRPPRS